MAKNCYGVVAILALLGAGVGLSQTAPATAPSQISLNFPENVELKTLVDYASQRLGLNIIYQDEQLAGLKVTIKTPQSIPSTALLGLVQSLLKMRGLALIDAEQPGFKRIVPLAASSRPSTQPNSLANAGEQVVTQAFNLESVDAQRAETAVKPFLSGPTAGSIAIPEQHLLLVTDFASNVARLSQIIALIDQPNRALQVGYIPVKNADASNLSLEVKQILQARVRASALPGQSPEGNFDVSQDRRTGQLIVVGSQAVLQQAREIVESLDVPIPEQQSPIRFYKLANATAGDVLETIRALEGESQSTTAPPTASPSGPPTASASGAPTNPVAAQATPGSSVNAAGASTAGGNPPLPGGISALNGQSGFGQSNGSPSGYPGQAGQGGSPFATSPPGAAGLGSTAVTSATPAPTGFRTRNASVAADPNTNTIIVVAEPAVQKMYEQLIKSLDKRRPQVLIEATLVSLDTSHGFSLGVELSGNAQSGKTQVVTFSSFGLSTPNPMTGALALTPGVGFNGAIVGSDVADVIVQALHTTKRATVSSAPRILVNDNATGTLSSLDGEPYTSTAIGNTISTTSFGGYAQAGTTVTLTPHISEADYLQLEYQVSVSSFTSPGNPTQGIPPGVQQDAIQSRVTIPDGSTVIVGGLNRKTTSHAIQGIPFLDQIPVVKYFFRQQSDSDEKITLFVFLRPIILRDDQFQDLRFLSERDIKAAGLPPGMPTSEPLPIR